MDGRAGVWILLLLAGGVVAVVVARHVWERRRREALGALAWRLGLEYFANDPFGIAVRFGRFDPLEKGSNRYAYNVIAGERPSGSAHLFDFHYETYSHGKHGRRTHHHHASYAILGHRFDLGRVRIRPENFLDKFAGALGFDDIDFESAAFSRRYWVKSADRRLAYDLLHLRMIEYLLGERDVGIATEGTATLFSFGAKRLSPEDFERLLLLGEGFLERVPSFLRGDRAVPATPARDPS